MTATDDDLTPDERHALGRLPRGASPPPHLEEATVAALTARGLLQRRRRTVHPALALAASLVLFLCGLALGRLGQSSSVADDARPRFVLFLYEGPEYEQPAPAGMAERVREYVAWAGAERENGAVEGGEKLREDVEFAVGSDAAAPISPNPDEHRLAGYFLVRAADRRAAVEIARSCPHVRYGGRIVVREIEPT